MFLLLYMLVSYSNQTVGIAKDCHLDILFLGGDNALPHEEAVVFEKLVILLWFLLALVQQEADNPLLQNITKLSEESKSKKLSNELKIT